VTAALPIKILLLEDDALDADMVAESYRRSDFPVEIDRVWEREGFERALATKTYDLVLSDYTLPSFDGITALRICRENYPALPFVIVSATLDEEAAINAMREGAADFLVKGRLNRLSIATKRALDEAAEKARRRQAERRLEDINAGLELLVDARTRERDRIWRVSQDLFAVFDLQGTILSANPAWKTVLGLSPSRVEGMRNADLKHPDDHHSSVVGVAKAQERQIVSQFEERLRHRDGSYRWISWSVAAPEDKRVFAVGRDITFAKEQAATLQKAEEQLRQSQKMEAIGQLTGGVAHDFNNLLTVIVGNLEYLQRQSAGFLTDKSRAAVESAMRGAQRAAKLTSSLLAFSRRQALDSRQIHANELMKGMSDLLARTISERISLRTDYADDLWWTQADANQLENAILNLAVNARDAMGEAGGAIIISTENVVLDHAFCKDADIDAGEYVLICVADTGPGMDASTLQQAFDPFFTTKDFGQGTGLGLSQVYGFVKQSGGHVAITSKVGHGTRVAIYLPRLINVVASPATAPQMPAAPRSDGETVLLVEDEADVRAYTKSILEELGYRVIEAADGPEAMAIASNRSDFKLLLTDIGLPNGMNGVELSTKMQAAQPSLKVLHVSGYASDAVVQRSKLDKDINLLRKPFSFAALAERLRYLLQDETRPRRVLLVEDEAMIRIVMADSLTEKGYLVEEAGSATEAIERVRELDGQLDAAILDLGLPDRPGDVLAQELRALHPELGLVIASGHAEGEMRQRLPGYAAIEFVTKPYDLDTLATAVERVSSRVA
jgi:PAS domain S-box-containing protein